MKNTLIVFENSLLNTDKNEVKNLLEDLSFNLAYKQVVKNPHNVREILNSLLVEFLTVLKKLDLFDDENTTKIIRALAKVGVEEAQNKLYNYISEMELLSRRIENQKNCIKNQINNYFADFENTIQSSNFKNEINQSLNDAILFDIETLGILKETAESAFLTTLEKAEDIELTSGEIAKNLVYNAICESYFDKERILQISSLVLNTAFEIANESIIFAKDLVIGSIKGTQEGIALSIEKFKNSLAFAHLEEDIKLKSKELIAIEDDFIAILREEAKKQINPSKAIIEKILEDELDNLFAKFKRFTAENREQINLFLSELKQNPKISNFSELTQRKINELKREIADFEKKTSLNYKDLNVKKAKKLGFRLWQKAKQFIHKTNEK